MTVPQGDGEALADAVLALAADPQRCRRTGSSARLAFEREYDKPHSVERWRQLVSELADADKHMLGSPDGLLGNRSSQR